MSDLRAGAAGRASGQPQNLIGWQVRRIRRHQRLTQPALAARCQAGGYNISRESIAKIEGRLRSVTDAEVILLAQALRVSYTQLYPGEDELTTLIRVFQQPGPDPGTGTFRK